MSILSFPPRGRLSGMLFWSWGVLLACCWGARGGDLLILCPEKWHGFLAEYVALRRAEGNRVFLEAPEEGGAGAVRHQIRCFYWRHGLADGSLFLVGDASRIPVPLAAAPDGRTWPTDQAYCYMDGEDDCRPDWRCGRLPAATDEEVRGYFERLVRWLGDDRRYGTDRDLLYEDSSPFPEEKAEVARMLEDSAFASPRFTGGIHLTRGLSEGALFPARMPDCVLCNCAEGFFLWRTRIEAARETPPAPQDPDADAADGGCPVLLFFSPAPGAEDADDSLRSFFFREGLGGMLLPSRRTDSRDMQLLFREYLECWASAGVSTYCEALAAAARALDFRVDAGNAGAVRKDCQWFGDPLLAPEVVPGQDRDGLRCRRSFSGRVRDSGDRMLVSLDLGFPRIEDAPFIIKENLPYGWRIASVQYNGERISYAFQDGIMKVMVHGGRNHPGGLLQYEVQVEGYPGEVYELTGDVFAEPFRQQTLGARRVEIGEHRNVLDIPLAPGWNLLDFPGVFAPEEDIFTGTPFWQTTALRKGKAWTRRSFQELVPGEGFWLFNPDPRLTAWHCLLYAHADPCETQETSGQWRLERADLTDSPWIWKDDRYQRILGDPPPPNNAGWTEIPPPTTPPL